MGVDVPGARWGAVRVPWNQDPTPHSTASRLAVPHLPRSHVAAEGVGMTTTSHIQLTLINGHTDTAVPAPAFVACAVVFAQGLRDTLSL